MRGFTRTGFIVLFSGLLAGQSPEATPRFEIADVHISPKDQRAVVHLPRARSARYEYSNATMLDLIRTAWGLEPDRILGGPNWLELDRFDVIAKVPADSTPESQKLMLQALLKDRFKLVAQEETKPISSWALTVGKKPLMKEADGSGEAGCRMQNNGSGDLADGGTRFTFGDRDGKNTTVNLGPGGTVLYACRNMTMAAFAAGLNTMQGVLIPTAVADRTGLQGKWSFDVKWSMGFMSLFGAPSDRISVTDAIEKQLGLKLEEVPVPQTVLVVDKVERTPSENAPEVKDALPEIKPPTEFEVADVKLAEPGGGPGGRPNLAIRMQPGGRFTAVLPMRLLLNQAFNINGNTVEQFAGLPGWLDSVFVSITAKMPAGYGDDGPFIYPDVIGPLLKSLLVERFGLAWHTEQRPGTAYKLVAAKPKLKKADPNSRIHCDQALPSPGQAPGGQVLNCQNATMQLFAERLQYMPTINGPVEDATGLEGGWDFTFSFNPLAQMIAQAGAGRGGGGGDAGPGGPGVGIAASDPSGVATVFETIEKQLGLKLEAQKKPVPTIVIDKLNQKPTDN